MKKMVRTAGTIAVAVGGVIALTAGFLGGPTNEIHPTNTFPSAGTDAFDSLAEVKFEIPCGGQSSMLRLGGPTRVKRGTSTDSDHDGKRDIATEILDMTLTGYDSLFGDVLVRESPTKQSTGKTESSRSGTSAGHFPANSFFDVFVEIEMTGGPVQGLVLRNEQPVRMTNSTIIGIPPIGSRYASSGAPIPLLNPSDQQVGCMIHAAHVPEDPSHILLFRELMAIQKKLDALTP